MFDRSITFVVAGVRIFAVEAALILAQRENIVGLPELVLEKRSRHLEFLTADAVGTGGERDLLALGRFRLLRDHVDHAAGTGAAVDRGVRAADDFQAIDVAL